MDIIKNKIELKTNPILEMLFSLQRIGVNKLYHKLSKEYAIANNEDIEGWVNEFLKSIDESMKELLNFYFNDDGYFGLGLTFIVDEMQEEKTFENFIAYIKKLSPIKMCNYLLLRGSEDKGINNFYCLKEEKRLFDIIEEYFTVSDIGKWQVLKILSKPEIVKAEIISLLNYFYTTFYKQKQKEVDKFITQYIALNEESLKQSFCDSVYPILSKKIESDLLLKRESIRLHISYFTDWGSYFHFEKDSLVIGFRYPEVVEIWGVDNQGLISKLSILKVLADETRLKILLQMNQGPKYLTEIADTLELSPPAIKYHLEKFLTVSLIQIEKAENRIYYSLNKTKIMELISDLKKSFKIE